TVQPGEVLTPPAEKLVAIYPAEGSLWSDNPATVLKASWVTPEQAKASEAFVAFLHTRAAQEVLPKYGFRPLMEGVPVEAHLNADVG
ncbi:substrate-binding domain-containing protein, partial [Priestia megaterium]|uniref:substrate-binding domain-containing protein n=1 Tax=Priestia megaterium TaxID=1404 RepID=UPI0035B5A2A6